MGGTRGKAHRTASEVPEVDNVSPELEALLSTFTDEEIATGVIRPRLTLEVLQAELNGMDRARGTGWLIERVCGVPARDLDRVMFGLEPVPEAASAQVVVAHVAVLLGTTRRAAARALGVSSYRLRKDKAVSSQVLDRAVALCRQWFLVHRVVGAEGAGSWFQDGNPGLEMARPLDLLATGYGQKAVDNLIEALLYGDVI